jgi:hypothetical protein
MTKRWEETATPVQNRVEAPGIELYRVAFLKSAMPLVFRR